MNILIIIILCLMVASQLISIWISLRFERTERETYSNNLAISHKTIDGLRQTNKRLEDDNITLSMAMEKEFEHDGFIISPKGINALPKNWRDILK